MLFWSPLTQGAKSYLLVKIS